MKNIQDIFLVESETWIDTLPDYQKNIINTLLDKSGNYEDVADAWLTAAPSHTVPFGTEKPKKIFLNKVMDEIELFITDDDKYKNERLSLLKESSVVQSYIVGLISTSLSPVLGVSSPFLAPVIAIILCIITKIGISAWLKTREELREKNNIEIK